MAKRIYVADDELHIRTLIQTFLVNEGYEVETFEDGNSLFDAFHASCPDIFRTDIHSHRKEFLFMKKITVFICAAALACSMSFPAFAAQTKKEYNTETAQVRQELADTSASIKNLQKSNRTASDAAKTVRQGWKDSGQLKEHKDTWNQVRELKDDITEVQVSYTEASSQARLLKAQAKNDVKDGKYDEAIAKLNQCLEQKKKALSSMEQINGIWAQIDSLLK